MVTLRCSNSCGQHSWPDCGRIFSVADPRYLHVEGNENSAAPRLGVCGGTWR
jgi:hypothetical protein